MSELGDLGGGIGSLFGGTAVLLGAGGKGGDAQYKQALAVWQKLQDPKYKVEDIPAAQLRVFAQYFPEQYKIAVPQNIQKIVESPELRLSELRTLKGYEGMAQNGMPLSERLAAQEGERAVANEAQRAQQAAQADVAQRGRLGTTDELVSRILANSQASDLARSQGADLAARSEASRLTGMQGAGQMASQIRGEDFQAGQANANIMNRLAEFIANEQTQANEYNAGAAERAQQENNQTAQRVGETNTNALYDAAVANQQRYNQVQGLLADYRLSKAQGLSNALTGYGKAEDQNKAAREATIMNMGTGAGKAAGSAAGMAWKI